MSYASPPIVTDSSARLRDAPPLKRPWGTAWATLPSTSAPLGRTTLPPDSTGVAIVALKWSPVLLVFDPTVLASRTVMTVPGGRVTSLGPNKLADLLEGALESELSSALLREQPIEMAAHRHRNNEANITRCRCTDTSWYGVLIVARPVYYVEGGRFKAGNES